MPPSPSCCSSSVYSFCKFLTEHLLHTRHCTKAILFVLVYVLKDQAGCCVEMAQMGQQGKESDQLEALGVTGGGRGVGMG